MNGNKCTLNPILSADQVPDEKDGVNCLPFLPLLALLKHYFYPMATTFDFNGTGTLKMSDIENMQLLASWIRGKSGHPPAIQFIINKWKDKRSDVMLIYYNAGSILELKEVFPDLNDEEYHQIGYQWCKLWSNLLLEDPRVLKEEFVVIYEPEPIKRGIRRINVGLSKEEDDFLMACVTPNDWSETTTQTTSTVVESIPEDKQMEAYRIWRKNQKDRQKLEVKPRHASFFQWKINAVPNAIDKLKVLQNEIQKIDLQTMHRISHHSKVKKYEKSLVQEATETIQQIIELQKEKEFYAINAEENEQLLNNFYLPNLNNAINDRPRKGIRVVEIVDQGAQYESEGDSLVDWSGQWSSDE